MKFVSQSGPKVLMPHHFLDRLFLQQAFRLERKFIVPRTGKTAFTDFLLTLIQCCVILYTNV